MFWKTPAILAGVLSKDAIQESGRWACEIRNAPHIPLLNQI